MRDGDAMPASQAGIGGMTMDIRREIDATVEKKTALENLERTRAQLNRAKARLEREVDEARVGSIKRDIEKLETKLAAEEAAIGATVEELTERIEEKRDKLEARRKMTGSASARMAVEGQEGSVNFYFDKHRLYRVNIPVSEDCASEELALMSIASDSSVNLGVGGQGIVLRAAHVDSGLPHAIKILRPKCVVTPEIRAMLGGDAAARLQGFEPIETVIGLLRAELLKMGVRYVPDEASEGDLRAEKHRARISGTHSVVPEIKSAINTLYGRYREAMQSFDREAKKLYRLSRHPNIVPLKSHGSVRYSAFRLARDKGARAEAELEEVPLPVPTDTTERWFMVSDLMPNGDLKRHIAQKYPEGRVDGRAFLGLAIELAKGVEAVHDSGIVHRDVKLENAFMDVDMKGRDVVRLGDLGNFGSPKNPIPAHQFLCSLENLPPETVQTIADGQPVVPAESHDIWGLGGALYEMLTGQPPVPFRHVPEEGRWKYLAESLRSAEPIRPVAALNPNVSADVAAIVMKCLEKSPARRYRSVSDVVKDLSGEASRAKPIRSNSAVEGQIFQAASAAVPEGKRTVTFPSGWAAGSVARFCDLVSHVLSLGK